MHTDVGPSEALAPNQSQRIYRASSCTSNSVNMGQAATIACRSYSGTHAPSNLSTRREGHASIDSDSCSRLVALAIMIVVSTGAWHTTRLSSAFEQPDLPQVIAVLHHQHASIAPDVLQA